MLNSQITKRIDRDKMSNTKKPKNSYEARKRIHNPTTGRYYQIRQRSSSKGERGTIMGTWSPPKDNERKKRNK
jgi:hypothetical protein